MTSTDSTLSLVPSLETLVGAGGKKVQIPEEFVGSAVLRLLGRSEALELDTPAGGAAWVADENGASLIGTSTLFGAEVRVLLRVEGGGVAHIMVDGPGHAISALDVIDGVVPDVFGDLTASFPEAMARDLRGIQFSDLRAVVVPARHELTLGGMTRLFGLEVGAAVTIGRFLGGPRVKVEFETDAGPTPVFDLLTHALGLDLDASLEPFFPDLAVAPRRLHLDTGEQTFLLSGVVEVGGHELEILLDLSRDVGVTIEIDAGEVPLSLATLAERLRLPVDRIRAMLPAGAWSKVEATSFSFVSAAFDPFDRRLYLEADAEFFGEPSQLSIEVDATSFKRLGARLSGAPVTGSTTLEALLARMGLDVPAELVPDVELSVDAIVVNQMSGAFEVRARLDAEGGPEVLFDLSIDKQPKGLLLTVSLTADPREPIDLLDVAQRVLRLADLDRLPIPDALEVGVFELTLEIETATKTVGGRAAGAVALGDVVLGWGLRREAQSWILESSIDVPIRLGAMIEDVLPDGFTLPDGLADLEIPEGRFEIDLGRRSFTLDTAGLGSGELGAFSIPEVGVMSVASLAVSLARPVQGPSTFELRLTGDIEVAGLGAELGGTLSIGTQGIELVPKTRTGGFALLPDRIRFTPRDRALSVEWQAKEDETVSIGDLVAGIDESLDFLPNEIDPQIEAFTFRIGMKTSELYIDARTRNLGDLFLRTEKSAAGRATLIGFPFPDDPARLGALLSSEVASALDSVPLDDIRVVFSTHALTNVDFDHLAVSGGTQVDATTTNPSGSLAASALAINRPRVDIEKGLNVIGTLKLEGDPLLGALGATVGVNALQVGAVLGRGVSLSARLPPGSQLQAGGQGFALSEASVLINLVPPGIVVRGGFDLSFHDTKIRATGGVAITVQEISAFIGATATREGADQRELPNLFEPLGLRGLRVQELHFLLGATFVPPALKTGFMAKFQVDGQAGTNELTTVLQIIPAAPAPIVNVQVLAFELPFLSVGTLLTTFAGSDAPALPAPVKEVQLEDVSFYYAQNFTVLPDGSTAQPGIGLFGRAQLFGFEAYADLRVIPLEGAHGHFQLAPLEAKVADRRLFALSGDGADILRKVQEKGNSGALLEDDASPAKEVVILDGGGPVFQFDSRGPKFLHANARVDLFDLYHQEVVAEIGLDGLTYRTTYAIADAVELELEMTATFEGGSPRFQASATFDLDLDLDIDIDVAGLDIASFTLDSEAHCRLEINVGGAQAFELILEGDFEFEGASLAIPRIRLATPPANLRELPELIFEAIRDGAEELFGAFVSSIEELWNAAGEEVEALIADADEALGEVAKETEKAIEAIGDETEKAIAATGKALESEVRRIREEAVVVAARATEEVNRIRAETQRALESITNDAERYASAAAKEAQVLLEDAGAFAAETKKQIKEVATKVAAEIAVIAKEAEKLARAIVDAGFEAAQKLLDEVNEVVRQLDKATKEIERAAKKVWDEVEDFFEDVGGAIGDAVGGIF